jgi:nucleoside 2-deoxyribosyltransferase
MTVPHIVGGKVRGENVHSHCATDEEKRLTWGIFYNTETAKGIDCERCGRPLTSPPVRRVYVAGRTGDIENVRLAQQICREAKCEITFDWTGDDGEIRSSWEAAPDRAQTLSERERKAVEDSDLVVLVWAVTDNGGPVGALLEVGMAMALKKRVIVVGPARESVFWYLPEVERVENLDALKETL